MSSFGQRNENTRNSLTLIIIHTRTHALTYSGDSNISLLMLGHTDDSRWEGACVGVSKTFSNKPKTDTYFIISSSYYLDVVQELRLILTSVFDDILTMRRCQLQV